MFKKERGWYIRSLTRTLSYRAVVGAIGLLLGLVPLACHHFFLFPRNSGELAASMMAHADQAACFRLIVSYGSMLSYLEWMKGSERVQMDYNGPTWQLVGGINSLFFNFGGVVHRSVNLDQMHEREVIVLSFRLHATDELRINSTTVAKFFHIIKSLKRVL